MAEEKASTLRVCPAKFCKFMFLPMIVCAASGSGSFAPCDVDIPSVDLTRADILQPTVDDFLTCRCSFHTQEDNDVLLLGHTRLAFSREQSVHISLSVLYGRHKLMAYQSYFSVNEYHSIEFDNQVISVKRGKSQKLKHGSPDRIFLSAFKSIIYSLYSPATEFGVCIGNCYDCLFLQFSVWG